MMTILFIAAFLQGIVSKIQNYKFQIPNKLQFPISNDQKRLVSSLGDLDLFEIWRLVLGVFISPYSMRSLENPLGGGDLRSPLIKRDPLSQRPSKSFEYSLYHVMAVSTIKEIDVKGYARMVAKSLEELLH
jgi:hypothetical protein